MTVGRVNLESETDLTRGGREFEVHLGFDLNRLAVEGS